MRARFVTLLAMLSHAPAGNPEPGSQAWQERDARNMICAGLRNRDQVASPAYGYQHHVSFPELHLNALVEQAQDPANPLSAEQALANPTDPAAGNAPYRIAGAEVANALSFYYDSAYSLTHPKTGVKRPCADMAAGC